MQITLPSVCSIHSGIFSFYTGKPGFPPMTIKVHLAAPVVLCITQMAKFSSCFHWRVFIRLLYVAPSFQVLPLTEGLDLLLGPPCLHSSHCTDAIERKSVWLVANQLHLWRCLMVSDSACKMISVLVVAPSLWRLLCKWSNKLPDLRKRWCFSCGPRSKLKAIPVYQNVKNWLVFSILASICCCSVALGKRRRKGFTEI